jgi:hypothetical protein
VLVVFVPSLTRDGTPIDSEYWRNQTVETLANLFGGATSVSGVGAWRDDDGTVLREDVNIVTTFMAKDAWNEDSVPSLAVFLRRMGRETEQGEIGLIADGTYYAIQEFNDEAKS